MSETITTPGNYTISAGSSITFSAPNGTPSAINFTASGSTPPPPDDIAFFITPYESQIAAVVNVVLEPFNNSGQRPGYNYNLQLPQGGFIPPGQQQGMSGAWTDAGILDDNAMQMALSLDYWSVKLGKTPTACATSCRKWWLATYTNYQSGSSFPKTQVYNPSVLPSRREVWWGKLSPVYGKINVITGTTSQIYWPDSGTPDGQDHGPNTTFPVVTAFPNGGSYSTNPSNFETFGAQIVLHFLKGDVTNATSMFAGAMKSVTSDGDLSGVYGGGKTRDLLFCLASSRVTGFWRNYQPQLQKMLTLLWSLQKGSVGLPQGFTGPGSPSGNLYTPEPQGQALLLSDPNLMSYFA